MGFQTQVNIEPAPAVKGDFAGANPRASVLAGEGALLSSGSPRFCTVGNFAWALQLTGVAVGQFYNEADAKIGFLRRDQQAPMLSQLPGDASMLLAPGQIVTLFDQGSFWALFAAGATPGQKVFANTLDGSVYAAAAGTSTETAEVTAALANTGILTVSAVASGAVGVGDIILGTTVPAGVAILAQLSGTPGGVGTYLTSLSGVVVASATMFAHDSVETNFFVDSPAAAGELAQISTWG